MKNLPIFFAALLVVSTLTGCARQSNPSNAHAATAERIQTATNKSSSVSPHSVSNEYANEYAKLIAYKTENYSQQSVAEINNLLLDGDISELLEAHSNVMADILPNDENYDFITLTLAASLDELYCEQMNDKVGISGYVKKLTQPVKPLQGEEDVVKDDQSYEFVFYAHYRIEHTIPNPSGLTISERDNALETLRTELQKYVDGLSESEITNGNIRTALTDKATELANSLSSDNIKLSCEISSIEIHNAGTETIQ